MKILGETSLGFLLLIIEDKRNEAVYIFERITIVMTFLFKQRNIVLHYVFKTQQELIDY